MTLRDTATARTIPVRFVRSAINGASERGIDLRPILATAAIPDALLADDRARCTPEQVTTFVRELWKLSEDQLFGLGPCPCRAARSASCVTR